MVLSPQGYRHPHLLMPMPLFILRPTGQVAERRGSAEVGAAPSPMEGVEGAGAAALDLELSLPEPADVEARYVAELGPLQVDDWDASAPGAYNRWAPG